MLRWQNVKNNNKKQNKKKIYKEIIFYILRWNGRYQRKLML